MNTMELAQKLAEAREVVEKAVVDNCPLPLFYADKDGRWFRANGPLVKLLSTDEDDLLVSRWQKLLTDRATKKEYDVAVRSKMMAFKLKLDFKAADGRLVPTFTSIVRLANGGFIGFIVPTCIQPVDCPIHCFLLENIQNGSNFAQVRG